MATFKHKETGKRFLLIHIPRTGGRFIEANLDLNGWEYETLELYGIPHYNHSFIEDCEITHFYKELYEKYCDIDGIEQVAVIRNPIERFFSASIFLKQEYGNDIQEKMEDKEQFFSMIENFPYSETKTWWRPQVDFISDTTHLWKFEDGLGVNFGYWLSEKLQVEFKIDAFAQYPMSRHEGVNQLDRTSKLIDNIRSLYKEDLDKFYPDL